MATTLNYINASSVSKSIKSIAYSNASAVLNTATKVYLGSTQVWSATTAAWVTGPTDGQTTYLAAYTPAAAMSVASFSMIFSMSSNYNVAWGIYTLSGSTYTALANSYGTTTTGVTITAGAVLGTATEYTYTKTYTASYPTLSAGTTYYFWVGERYQPYNLLNGSSGCPGYAPAWAAGSSSMAYTAGAKSNIYLSVVAH
jgi:hypothetical protein